MLSIPGMILVVGSVLQEYNKYYSQVMCVYICGLFIKKLKCLYNKHISYKH